MRTPRRPSRIVRRTERLLALALLLGVQVLSAAPPFLEPDPLDEAGRSALTRRDPSGSEHRSERLPDRACVLRKAAAAPGLRSPSTPDPRGLVALDRSGIAAPAGRGASGSELTSPAYLRIFHPAGPQSLRAPPVRT